MSLDAERALTAALLSRLRAASALADPLGAPVRVYDEPPASPLYPYLHLGRVQTTAFGGSGGEGAAAEGVELEVTLTCVSRYGGAEEAKRVNGLLRDLLHDASFAVTDWRLVNLRVTYGDVFRASDWRSTYGVSRLRAVLEPAA